MSYDIELVSLGEDLYPDLQAAAKLLNGVQEEFRFRAAPEHLREAGLQFQRQKYVTTDIWEFLTRYRESAGAMDRYIIAFLNGPLSSTTLQNLFASHEANRRLAAATFFGHTQFVSDTRRYCSYYLVRYALSFVNPDIRSHDDPDRKDCYFHRKMYKPDIKASMLSGKICDPCMRELEKKLSIDEKAALRKMRDVVSGQYPYALIMKGGGIKGIAFAGALIELEKYFSFDLFAGASAGAIASVLLASGYTPRELHALLNETDFGEFLDASFIRLPLNLLFRFGCYPGEQLRRWIHERLSSKINRLGEVRLMDLPSAAVLYACSAGSGTVVFDSRGTHKEAVAAFATRCSMSIPLVFFPCEVDGRRVYDGGMRNNFPVAKFVNDYPGKPFLGLYLGAQQSSKLKRFILSELLDIWIGGDELSIVDSHADSIVVIDTAPVSTLDFTLTNLEKQFLLNVGKAGALTLLKMRKAGPTAEEVEAAKKEADRLRTCVITARRQSRLRRIAFTIALIAALVLLSFVIRRYSLNLFRSHSFFVGVLSCGVSPCKQRIARSSGAYCAR